MSDPLPEERSDAPAGLREAVRRKGSFGQTMKAVAWSFFGVRKSSDYQRDVEEINPVHVVVAGVLGAMVFVGVLVLVVGWVTSGTAA